MFKQIICLTAPILLDLHNTDDAVRGFTCDFPSSRFGIGRARAV